MRRDFLKKLGIGLFSAPLASKALAAPETSATSLEYFEDRPGRHAAILRYSGDLSEQKLLEAAIEFQDKTGARVDQVVVHRTALMTILAHADRRYPILEKNKPAETNPDITMFAAGVHADLKHSYDLPRGVAVIKGRA
jgi:hypothetical protein